jgi:succinoglycan biosynthesis transport protein ExoP
VLFVLLLIVAGVVSLKAPLPGLCVAIIAGALGLAIFVRVRQAAVPRAFLAAFLLIFLLAFGAAVLITALLPESYLSTARVKVTRSQAEAAERTDSNAGSQAYDPHLVQTECEVIQSEEILGSVITALDLDREWGKRYAKGPLNPAATLALLQRRIALRPVRNTSIIAIGVYDDQREEAARLANEIAQAYKDHNSLGPLQVEIIDRAVPGRRPVRPNKPLNLAVGALLGLVLGVAVGAALAGFRAGATPR